MRKPGSSDTRGSFRNVSGPVSRRGLSDTYSENAKKIQPLIHSGMTEPVSEIVSYEKKPTILQVF
jgi:hypothetical protein